MISQAHKGQKRVYDKSDQPHGSTLPDEKGVKKRKDDSQFVDGEQLTTISFSPSSLDPSVQSSEAEKSERTIQVSLKCTDHEENRADTLKSILIRTIKAIRIGEPFDFVHRGTYGTVLPAKGDPSESSSQFVVKTNQKDKFSQDFLHEARLQHGLQHINILPCPSYAFHASQVFLLLPRADETLDTRLVKLHNKKVTILWPDRYQVCLQVAEGLCYLHEHKIVHCDLTPYNVLLSAGNHAWISDFGRAKKDKDMNSNVSLYKTAVCKHRFREKYVQRPLSTADLQLAPELYNGDTITTQSDIYSWGKILLNMLQGDNLWLSWTNHPICEFLHCPKVCEHFCWPDDDKYSLRSFTHKNEILAIDKELLCTRNLIEKDSLPQFRSLACQCLQLQPEHRPASMMTALKRARAIAQKYSQSKDAWKQRAQRLSSTDKSSRKTTESSAPSASSK